MSIDQKTQTALRINKLSFLPVSRVMETTVRSEEREASAELIASLLMEGFGSVPIIDQAKRLIGIVSEFDLLHAIRKGKVLANITAQDIMTKDPVSVSEDVDVGTVIEILHNNHLIRMPVVDSTRKVVGIIARRDILRSYLHSHSQPKM